MNWNKKSAFWTIKRFTVVMVTLVRL